MRLGIYADLVYSARDDSIFTDEAVIRFLIGLRDCVGELTLLGRLAPEPADGPYLLPSDVRFTALPYYASVADVRGLAGGVRRSCAIFQQELDGLDAVWLFGPHPLSLLFAALARRKRKPVFLGVRQDFPSYIAGRLPSPRWRWALPVAWSAEWTYRRLARRFPTVVVGEDLARKYRAEDGPVLATGFSLVQSQDVVAPDEALEKPWTGELRILSVSRLDPEKNPTLLPEILARLMEADDGWRMAIAGDGPMAGAVRARAEELGVSDALELLGYVPNGTQLQAEYRRSHAFAHVSFTEGLPQVIFEAQAAGLPIVATDVGGVAAALEQGETGLLVPANDSGAMATALERLRGDESLRRRFIEAGIQRARNETMDVQLDRISVFLRHHASLAGLR